MTINSSHGLKYVGGFYVYDHYTRSSTFLFAGETTTDSNGFISTIQQSTVSSVATWTTSVKYSSIYGIQSVQKIDTGKNGNPDVAFLINNNQITIAQGLSIYQPTHTTTFSNFYTVYSSTQYVQDFRAVDLDHDGCQDLVLIKSNGISFLENTMNSNLTQNYFGLYENPIRSGTVVNIWVPLSIRSWTYQTPQVVISNGVNVWNYPMVNATGLNLWTNSTGLNSTWVNATIINGTWVPFGAMNNFIFNFTIPSNGTFTANVSVLDQWGNYIQQSVIFFGEQIDTVNANKYSKRTFH